MFKAIRLNWRNISDSEKPKDINILVDDSGFISIRKIRCVLSISGNINNLIRHVTRDSYHFQNIFDKKL